MAMGMPWELARVLGFDPPTTFTAAGSSSQANATLLTANHAIVTTTTTNQGVIIGDAQQMWYVQNSVGGNTVNVYPPVGGTFSGLSLNAAIAVPSAKAIFIEPGGLTGITWGVSA
jgi:hypothetical protein